MWDKSLNKWLSERKDNHLYQKKIRNNWTSFGIILSSLIFSLNQISYTKIKIILQKKLTLSKVRYNFMIIMSQVAINLSNIRHMDKAKNDNWKYLLLLPLCTPFSDSCLFLSDSDSQSSGWNGLKRSLDNNLISYNGSDNSISRKISTVAIFVLKINLCQN